MFFILQRAINIFVFQLFIDIFNETSLSENESNFLIALSTPVAILISYAFTPFASCENL